MKPKHHHGPRRVTDWLLLWEFDYYLDEKKLFFSAGIFIKWDHFEKKSIGKIKAFSLCLRTPQESSRVTIRWNVYHWFYNVWCNPIFTIINTKKLSNLKVSSVLSLKINSIWTISLTSSSISVKMIDGGVLLSTWI